MPDFAFILAGFAVGLIVGLTGVGGGSLMTPVLIFVFGVKPNLAVGTDLLFAAFTKLGGTVGLARQRLVPWRVVAQLCAGSIPAALLALWALRHLGPDSAAAQRLMTTTLGAALLLTAAATFYKVLVFSPERAAAEAARRRAQSADATRPRHWSLPVLLGTVGGVGLLVGPAGLAWLKRRRDPELADPAQRGMEAGFLALLFLTSLTGLALLGFRETAAMGMLLVAHLGVVLALFATMPYGKFVHALYRLAALARFRLERRRPPEHTAPE